MLNNICTDTQVLAKWLKSGVVDEGTLYPTKEGTPQGGIISPVLANLVLDGLEDLLGSLYGSVKLDGNNHQRIKHKVNFVRYADDFVITCNSKETLVEEIKPLVREFLADRGLELSEEKTKVTHISEGFDFLSQNVRKYRAGKPNARLLIKPSKKAVKTFLAEVRGIIRALRTATQEEVIRILNPKITGWANYHRHVVSKNIFSNIDSAIWQALWRWACRRHPMKRKKWVKDRYWKRSGGRDWTFFGNEVDKQGANRVTVLKRMSYVAIERHVKIKGSATPFDPVYEEYFEKRLAVKMEKRLEGRRKLLYLWKQQDGLCPVCGNKITKLTGWHSHHLVRRVDGGSDQSSNLLLLHPACHQQGHASGFKFVLPVKGNS
ncbi:MAG: hypothetical protein NVSMB6_25770 [Burkholderiaceae bacterium]